MKYVNNKKYKSAIYDYHLACSQIINETTMLISRIF